MYFTTWGFSPVSFPIQSVRRLKSHCGWWSPPLGNSRVSPSSKSTPPQPLTSSSVSLPLSDISSLPDRGLVFLFSISDNTHSSLTIGMPSSVARSALDVSLPLFPCCTEPIAKLMLGAKNVGLTDNPVSVSRPSPSKRRFSRPTCIKWVVRLVTDFVNWAPRSSNNAMNCWRTLAVYRKRKLHHRGQEKIVRHLTIVNVPVMQNTISPISLPSASSLLSSSSPFLFRGPVRCLFVGLFGETSPLFGNRERTHSSSTTGIPHSSARSAFVVSAPRFPYHFLGFTSARKYV